MSKVIEIRDCTASYGENEVLHRVSLTVERGELVVIIGPSGCGKTTLLKMMNGIVRPTEGEVRVNGEKLFPHMTVRDNICYVPSLEQRMPKEEKQKLSEKMLELVQLPTNLADRFPRQLSGGQQQRVGIARAMAADADILLMDEPFGAVDEITRRGLQDELLSLQRKTGITIVFITHDIEEALRLGSRILIMKEGVIRQEGTGERLLESPRDAFVRKLMRR